MVSSRIVAPEVAARGWASWRKSMRPRGRLPLSSWRSPAAHGTPRPSARRHARQVSWLPGLRSSSAFPGVVPVASGWVLTGYSCGDSRGIAPRSLKSLPGTSRW